MLIAAKTVIDILAMLRQWKVQKWWYEKWKSALRVVDLATFATKPAVVSLPWNNNVPSSTKLRCDINHHCYKHQWFKHRWKGTAPPVLYSSPLYCLVVTPPVHHPSGCQLSPTGLSCLSAHKCWTVYKPVKWHLLALFTFLWRLKTCLLLEVISWTLTVLLTFSSGPSSSLYHLEDRTS